MRIAYFDCFSGISGDMILGALVDVGLDPDLLRDRLARLPLKGYRLEVSRESRGHLWGTRVRITLEEDDRAHRSCGQIRELIRRSALPAPAKEKSLAVVARLAEVEGRLHGVPPDDVHFHEMGALDSIVDIVGTCVGIHALEITRIVASPLPMGRGFVRCDHGLLPLPAPATVGLLEGAPVYDAGQDRELVTPTGAALLSVLASEFGGVPRMRIERVGYGVGHHWEDDPPNLLRVITGQAEAALPAEKLLLLETSLDDMNPEIYGYLMERLFGAGALDVTIIPAQMKKNRPGQLLRVLLPPGLRDRLISILLSETTTLGVRCLEVERVSLPRTIIRVRTPFGPIPVKVARNPEGGDTMAPEYEVCRRAARRHQVPIRLVYEAALCQARERLAKDDTARRRRGDRGTG
ncbi:MAG TPA: nickel pincer cofactor biosynthesis protein LarC [Syntrophobacteria bacterium]|nr:nickel pincer cofactor biosynthesis protein LarC [Syntrophobacteria bacterium]